MAIMEQIYESVSTGKLTVAPDLVRQALGEGLDAFDILNNGLISAMNEVGRRFEEGKYFVPEMLLAARTMKACLPILKPKLLEADVKPVGKVVIGTVKGDLHDIGKNLVAMMLEGAGFEIIDLGTGVSPEKFVAEIKKSEAELVGMSALLTTTMPAIKSSIEAIKEAGLRERVKIKVGRHLSHKNSRMKLVQIFIHQMLRPPPEKPKKPCKVVYGTSDPLSVINWRIALDNEIKFGIT